LNSPIRLKRPHWPVTSFKKKMNEKANKNNNVFIGLRIGQDIQWYNLLKDDNGLVNIQRIVRYDKKKIDYAGNFFLNL
jgi:hypothetical protein